mmetsp:Transcript_12372/g.19032  ORF Transcript_12372/g.19032 Transcript_12372/m.19032 type:complete len:223 (+) Transcript_12372:586-1254(+)
MPCTWTNVFNALPRLTLNFFFFFATVSAMSSTSLSFRPSFDPNLITDMAAFSIPSLTEAYVRNKAVADGPKTFMIFIFLSPNICIPPEPAPPPFSKCSLILLASILLSSSPSFRPRALATRSCSSFMASDNDTPSRYSIARTCCVHISSTTLGILTKLGSTPYFCMSRVHSLRLSASSLKSNSFSCRFRNDFATSMFSGANNLVAISRLDKSASNNSATSGY